MTKKEQIEPKVEHLSDEALGEVTGGMVPMKPFDLTTVEKPLKPKKETGPQLPDKLFPPIQK